MTNTYQIVTLPGDGVGPEVSASAERVLRAVADREGFGLSFENHLIGGAACDGTGEPLPDESLAACRRADAVFLGAVGGSRWDHLPREKRPEAGLLRLRQALDVFCNLRPITVHDSQTPSSPLKADRVRGTDMLIVRELTGGLYFGEPRGLDKNEAFNTMRYASDEVTRIARIAFDHARLRRGRVTSIDKANVLEASVLWRRTVIELQEREFPDVELNHMYVDNAAMQIVLNPGRFDVILTGNLFGDVLSDLAATLPGSVGLLASASIGGKYGLFEPVHGSAPDLAGKGTANPTAAILSAGMMLDYLEEREAARAIRLAVRAVYADAIRTPDMALDGVAPVGTGEMTDAIIARLGTSN